jgi:hypothetical protein
MAPFNQRDANLIALKTFAGRGTLTAGPKIRVGVRYKIDIREVSGSKRIVGTLVGPPEALGGAWKLGRSRLILETGESLDVVVLSLIGTDVAPIEVSARAARRVLTGDTDRS